MKPDLTDYDTLDVTALKKAEIPIELCDGCVRYAMKQELPRYQIAGFFLLQLETAIKLNLIDFILDNGDGFLQPEYFVHKDILNNWPEMDYPPIPYDVAVYLKEREGQTIAPNPTPPGLIKRRPARKKKTEPVEKPATRKKTSYDPDEPPPRSVYSVLGLLLADLKYYEKYDEQGRKGGQGATINHIQGLIEELHISDKGLSKSSLQRIINTALDVFNSSFLPDKRQK